jgi:hypothetical protein
MIDITNPVIFSVNLYCRIIEQRSISVNCFSETDVSYNAFSGLGVVI